MFLIDEGLSVQGLGTVFSLFLLVLLLLRIATREVSKAGRRTAFLAAWAVLTITPTFRFLSADLGHKDAYIYQLQFLSDAGAAGEPMALTGTGGASEPLYLLLIKVLRMVTDNPHAFFFIAYGTIAFGFVYFLSQTLRADSPVLPLLLIFPAWLHAFSAVRNWAAIALVLVGLTWYMRRRTVWFFVWVLLATGLHFSAALFLLLPLAGAILFRRRTPGWIIGVLAVLNVVAMGSSEILTRVLAGTRYAFYLGDESTSSVLYVLPMAVLVLIGLLFVQPSDRLAEHEKRLLVLPVFVSGLITIILFYGGYRYMNFAILPLAVMASWALTTLPTRFPGDAFMRTLWRVVIYATTLTWTVSSLRSVINLSGVFPVIWDN